MNPPFESPEKESVDIREEGWDYGLARYLLWAAGQAGRKTAFNVLPIRVHLSTAQLRGRMYALSHANRPHVLENIEAAFGTEFGPTELENIARQYHSFTKRLYLERVVPMLPHFSERHDWIITGVHHLDNALAGGRGAIIATAHLGFSRLIAPLLRARGYDVKQVVAGGKDRLERKMKRDEYLARSSKFRRLIHDRTRVLADRIGADEVVAGLDVRPILKALASNSSVLIAGDGVRATEFVELPLLNKTYPFASGFMKMAMAGGCPVIPAFAVEAGREIVLEFHPPIAIDPKADVSTNLEQFAHVLASQLHKTPHLWSRWAVPDLFNKAIDWTRTDIRHRHSASHSL